MEQPKPENQEDQILIKVTQSAEGQIKMHFASNLPIQTVTYIHRLIGVEIDKKIIDGKIRQSQVNGPGIIIPNNNKPHKIIDFLRGRNAN